MRLNKSVFSLLTFVLCVSFAFCSLAEDFAPLPMDNCVPGPAPSDKYFISDMEYSDPSISVKLYEDRYADTDYLFAHIKVSHPSQLRTAPALMADKSINPESINFRHTAEFTYRGRNISDGANAVIALNGDFFIKTDKCQVVLRQGQQVRNAADGTFELLAIDINGDFHGLRNYNRRNYNEYLDAHESELYQVFCFGPILVENGKSVIDDQYRNGYIGSYKNTQRSAIAQLGPLEYMFITCSSDQASEEKTVKDKGMTIQEFAVACEQAGKKLRENGCIVAYNLDGGNSSTMNFKRRDAGGQLSYTKINPGTQERPLSDIVYFATLVK